MQLLTQAGRSSGCVYAELLTHGLRAPHQQLQSHSAAGACVAPRVKGPWRGFDFPSGKVVEAVRKNKIPKDMG